MCMSDAQHATARPAHHTPICPANLGVCPEAPVVPATPRFPRAGRGSSSLGSAHPSAEGPPSLGQPRNDPTFGGRSPPARGRSPPAQSWRGGALSGKPTCIGSAVSPSSRGRRASGQQGSGSAGAQRPGCARRLRAPWCHSAAPAPGPAASRSQRCRCGDAGATRRRGKRLRTRLGTERPGARQQQAVPWHAGRVGFWEM